MIQSEKLHHFKLWTENYKSWEWISCYALCYSEYFNSELFLPFNIHLYTKSIILFNYELQWLLTVGYETIHSTALCFLSALLSNRLSWHKEICQQKEKPCQFFIAMSHIHFASKYNAPKSSETAGMLEHTHSHTGVASCPRSDHLFLQKVAERVGWAMSNSHMKLHGPQGPFSYSETVQNCYKPF
jgi:hypothetical protein